MLGIALGCIGLSYDDFCRLNYEEFAAIYKAYAEQRDAEYKDGWERVRILATIGIQPHTKRKITAQKLLPFPWDKKRPPRADGGTMTREEQLKRFRELTEKLGKNYKQ